MRALATAALLAGSAVLTACAPVPALRIADPAVPRAHELTQVAFHPQDEYQCGPAALATVLNHAGTVVTPEQLVPRVFLPAREGSLQVEMIAATRQFDRVPYVLDGTRETIVREVAAGHPVLVLQNLGLGWLPVWHYAVVVGYDVEREEFILRSGREARLATGLATFERTWARGEHWALSVTAPGDVPFTADESRYLAAIAPFERLGRSGTAAQAYAGALQRWPESNTARFGLANASYALGQRAGAERLYRDIVARDPRHAAAWNNLAQVLFDLERWADAEAAAQRAVELGGASVETARRTLAEIRARRTPPVQPPD
jgi:hypothetical protein